MQPVLNVFPDSAFYYQYCDPSSLLVFDGMDLFEELESSEGVRQGDPFASFAFALAVQPLYERALKEAPRCKGISIQDDLNIVGPAAEVMAAYDYILAHAAEFGLELVPNKCQVFLPDVGGAVEDLHTLADQCAERNVQLSGSMESLGVMFGSDEEIEAHAEAAVTASESFFDALTHEEMPVQTAFSLLRYCALPRLGYLARTAHPERLDKPAQRFDRMAVDTLTRMMKWEDDNSLCTLERQTADVAEDDDNRASVVSREQLLQRISLPISAGGFGIRPVHRIRHAAYFASLTQMLPDFLRMHPELQAGSSTSAAAAVDAQQEPASSSLAYQSTQLFVELEYCRKELLASGAGNRRIRRQAEQQQQQQQRTLEQQPLAAPVSADAASSTGAEQPNHASPLRAIPALPSQRDSSLSLPALKKGTDDTWQAASRCARNVKQQPFSLAAKLQLVLTEGIEHTQYQQCYDSCGAYQQAIQRSLSENDNCSAWLTVLPTEPAYRMRDDQFRLAARHRLGMLPYDDLRDDYCLTCRRRNSSIPHFLADPDHLHACVKQTGAMLSLRHDRIAATLATLARSVGFAVKREPPFEHRTRLHTRVDEETGEEHDELATDRSRGDLLLVRHNTRLVVDVTVTRPTAKTELRLRKGVPLASAAAAEKRKHKSYDDACERDGATMVPFAVESYGAKGKQAQKLLLKLADASEELSAEAFLRHASAVVSVALQCGNADIAARGTQSLRMRQARARNGSYDTSHHELQPAGRRRRKSSQQESGDYDGAENDYNDRFHASAAFHFQINDTAAFGGRSGVAA